MLPSYIVHIFALAAMLGFTIAEPIPLPKDANELRAADPEALAAELAADELVLDEIVDVDMNEALAERDSLAGPTPCGNKGKIKRVKKEYKGACNPKDSKGFRSSHNCKNAGGKSYLCVINNKATCYNNLKGLNYEHGECFL